MTGTGDRTAAQVTEGLAGKIDHTLLKGTAQPEDIEKLCREARQYEFASVCLPSCYVSEASRLLSGSSVKVCTVVGFPLGNSLTQAKVSETEEALVRGATEIDMVLNRGFLLAGDSKSLKLAAQDIAEVADAVRASRGSILKVILEICDLNPDQIVQACKISVENGAHFVKTSTGFGSGNATTEAVKLMRETVGDRFGVKASGGIRTLRDACQMLSAGASRLGCSSSVAIMQELTHEAPAQTANPGEY